MQNNKIIIGIVAVLLLGAMAFAFSKCNQREIDWKETFKEQKDLKSLKPYDFTLLKECLDGGSSGVVDVKNSLSKALNVEGDTSNYVFIGEALRADSTDFNAMHRFLENGNTVVWSAKYFSTTFFKKISKEEKKAKEENSEATNEEIIFPEDELREDTTTIVENDEPIEKDSALKGVEHIISQIDSFKYHHDDLSGAGQRYINSSFQDSMVEVRLLEPKSIKYTTGYFNYFKKDKSAIEWNRFNEMIAKKLIFPYTVIGKIDSFDNCIAIQYGKGRLILHSNPILFSNVELVNTESKEYVASLLSLLKKGTIFWDNHNRTTVMNAMTKDLNNSQSNQNKAEKTPLQYILTNQSLSWAWYSLLGMGVFYLIFAAKRKQRIIPVLVKNENTSLAFIQSIGRLYFNRGEHTSLCRTQFQQWKWFVRQRYGLKTNLLDSEFIKKLSISSGIAMSEIDHLLQAGKYMETYNVGEGNLLIFHKELDAFYKKCK